MLAERKMRNKTNQVLFVAFYPKALNSQAKAGLLTCSLFRRPSHPTQADSGEDDRKSIRTYSSGTVQDFHLIPY